MNPASASSSRTGLAQTAEELGERLGDLSYALRPLLAALGNATVHSNQRLTPSELVQFELLALRGRWVMRMVENVVATAERRVSGSALRAAA
jgi:hypothetical protein